MGKGRSSETEAASEHVSRPLTTLKDPSSFGPPPKNVNYHGGAALPHEITPHRNGLGAPLTQPEIQYGRGTAQDSYEQEEELEQPAKSPPPALPYRADRTGLKTDNLPPPPVRNNGPSPSVPASQNGQPRLPPRLPARQSTGSPVVEEAPPPSYNAIPSQSAGNSFINQSAASRLGRAGISVPGLGINNQAETNPWKNEASQSRSSSTNQLNELQSRFARMNSSSGDSKAADAQQQPSANNAPPSWKQSQSAFNTAQNLRSNPQAVTLADAQSAAQTAGQAQRSASAFKEKHGDKITAAQTKAKAWDQKFKVTSKINKFLDEHSEADQQQQLPQLAQHPQQPMQPATGYNSPYNVPQHTSAIAQPVQSPPLPEITASIARKPPPPPAPRKPVNLQAPPPVPTGTKPSFG